jgi:transcriptional regulator with XRE-family HTH domain
MPARPKVGAKIRRARQLLDMRQQDLADKIGVSRNTVDSWENDRAYPQRKLARLEEVLGVSLEGEPAPEPGPLDDLKPWQDDWEAQVANDSDMPVSWRRDLINDSRDARARYAARRAQRRAADRQAG